MRSNATPSPPGSGIEYRARTTARVMPQCDIMHFPHHLRPGEPVKLQVTGFANGLCHLCIVCMFPGVGNAIGFQHIGRS